VTAEVHNLAELRRQREATRRMLAAIAEAQRTPEARQAAALEFALEHLGRYQSLLGVARRPLIELVQRFVLVQIARGETPDPWEALATAYTDWDMINIIERVKARHTQGE
jgi:hypothetical protein